eukprot:5474431-Pleurochrysis_carterae.AAC.1
MLVVHVLLFGSASLVAVSTRDRAHARLRISACARSVSARACHRRDAHARPLHDQGRPRHGARAAGALRRMLHARSPSPHAHSASGQPASARRLRPVLHPQPSPLPPRPPLRPACMMRLSALAYGALDDEGGAACSLHTASACTRVSHILTRRRPRRAT